MWFYERQRDNRHDLHSKTTSREMPRTESRLMHDAYVLTTVCDTVSRDGLWKITAKLRCSPEFIAIVRQFHDGMQAQCQNDGEFSEPYKLTDWVKQDCVMAPTP